MIHALDLNHSPPRSGHNVLNGLIEDEHALCACQLLEVRLDFVVVYRLDALVVVGSLPEARILKEMGSVLV